VHILVAPFFLMDAQLIRKGVQGALGDGLIEKVREAYYWLAQNYEQGDEVRPFQLSFRLLCDRD